MFSVMSFPGINREVVYEFVFKLCFSDLKENVTVKCIILFLAFIIFSCNVLFEANECNLFTHVHSPLKMYTSTTI